MKPKTPTSLIHNATADSAIFSKAELLGKISAETRRPLLDDDITVDDLMEHQKKLGRAFTCNRARTLLNHMVEIGELETHLASREDGRVVRVWRQKTKPASAR